MGVKKSLLFSALAIAVVLLHLLISSKTVISAGYPSPGHPADDISGGGFHPDFGDFTFPAGVNVIVNDSIGVGTLSPVAALHVQGSTIIGNNSGTASLVANTGVFGTGSTYGVAGMFTNAKYGFLGSTNYGAYGQFDANIKGYIGSASYGAYGQYDSNNYGYLGGNGYGVYGKGSSYAGYFAGNLTSTKTIYAANFSSPASTDLRIITNGVTAIFINDSSEDIGFGTSRPRGGLEVVSESYEGFEIGNGFVEWTNAATDDFDWTRRSGQTPSVGTGPASAHADTYYIFIETSAGAQGDVASIVSSSFTATDSSRVSFWYHMYGATIANITVEANDGSWDTIWTKAGQQQYSLYDAWTHAYIDLSDYDGDSIQLRINGTKGSSFTGDISIDDIVIHKYSPTIIFDDPAYFMGGLSVGANAIDQDLKVEGNLNVTGNITVGSGTIFVDGTNNKIGVGTTSPSTRLDVQAGAVIGNKSGAGSLMSGSGVFGTGSTYGVYGQYDVNKKGYMGSSSYGAYGQYDSNKYGYIGSNSYAVYAQYNSTVRGYIGGVGGSVGIVGNNSNSNVYTGKIGNSTYGLIGLDISNGRFGYAGSNPYGLYGGTVGSNVLGYFGSNDYGAYGQYSSSRYGFLGNGSYGAYGQYDSDTYGYLGSSSYGMYGQYDSNYKGYIGSSNIGAYGQYSSSRYGLIGNSNYGAYGTYDGGTILGYLGSTNYGAYGQYDSNRKGYLGGTTRGLYGQYDSNINGYLGGTYGAYGQYTSTKYGYLGGTYGVYGQYDANIKGYLGGSYGLYGIYTSNRFGALGTSSSGAYGQYDSNIAGLMGSSSYGVFGQYTATRYGYLGGDGTYSRGAYGQYDANIKGYLGGTYGAYGQYDSGNYGILGASYAGAHGVVNSNTEIAVLGSNSAYTAILASGTVEIEYGGFCIDDSTGCDYNTAPDNSAVVRDGYLCISNGTASYCDGATINDGEVYVQAGAVCVDNAADDCEDADLTPGSLYADFTTIQGGLDLAENYPSLHSLEPGDLVSIDTQQGIRCSEEPEEEGCKNISGLVPFVSRSEGIFDSKIIGVVSTEPGVLLGGFANKEFNAYNQFPIALAGRVPVKVTDENGAIKTGDLITASSKPGYAMRWSLLDISSEDNFDRLKLLIAENEKRKTAVIGKALEPFDSGEGKIIALINLQ